MSVWASLNWVASLPSAFCTTYCEDVSPAFWKDSFRYGASNSTYRVEDTVSGRITATVPLPLAASGLSVAMAENELLIWLRDSCGTEPLLLLGLFDAPDEPPLPLLPQAAATSAALPATAVSAAIRVKERKGTTSLWRGTSSWGRCRAGPPAVAAGLPPSIWGNTKPTPVNRAVNIPVTP